MGTRIILHSLRQDKGMAVERGGPSLSEELNDLDVKVGAP
jgi:hypothetical protein